MAKPRMLYARDLDGTGSLHICAQGDPCAIEFVEIDLKTWEALKLMKQFMTQGIIAPGDDKKIERALERLLAGN